MAGYIGGKIVGVTLDSYSKAEADAAFQAIDADTAKTDVAQTFTAAQRGTVITDNDLSYDMNAGNNFVSTISASGTLQFTNINAGQSGNITMTITGSPAISAAAHVRINASELTRISTDGVYRVSYYSPDGINVDVSVGSAITTSGA